MWIMTPYGFFSVVCAKDSSDLLEADLPRDDKMVIRARDRAHLENLKKAIPGRLPRINSHAGTDYPFRITADRDVVLAVVARMAEDIDYTNFKNEAHRVSPKDKPFHKFLMEIWNLGHSMSPRNVRGVTSRHPWKARWKGDGDLDG